MSQGAIVNPNRAIPRFRLNNVTPFTYRDGLTFLELIEELREWTTEAFPAEIEGIIGVLVDELREANEQFDAGVDEFQRIHDAFMADVNTALMALNDSAASELADDPESVFGSTLRELFASRQDFDGMRDSTQVASTQNTDIYVATNGNDNNTGDSEENAVRTLARAVELIPDVVHRGHVYTVRLGIGDWSEDLRIVNRDVRGKVHVTGITGNPELHRINRLRVENVSGHVHVDSVEATVQGGAAFWFNRSAPHMELDNVRNVDIPENNEIEGSHGVLADFGSHVMVRNSHFENKRYATRVNYLSRMFVAHNTGSGNRFGVGARWGGHVSVFGDQPDAVTKYTTSSGGTVVQSTGGKIGGDTLDVGSPVVYETREGAHPNKKWSLRASNGRWFSNEVPVDGSLRLIFEHSANANSSARIETNLVYTPVNSTTVRNLKHLITAMLMPGGNSNIHSVNFIGGRHGSGTDPENMITMGNLNDGNEFYIDFHSGPTGMRSSYFSVDVEISMGRDYSAPIFKRSQIIG